MNVSRTAAAEERVADADVGRDGDWQKADSAPCGIDAVKARVRSEARQKRRREIRVIQDIKNLRAQLQRDVFGYFRRFEHRKIEIFIPRTDERISAEAAEMIGSRHANAVRVERAGDFERRQVQEIIRRARSGVRVADQIGTREKFAGAVVIVEEVDVKRRARAKRRERGKAGIKKNKAALSNAALLNSPLR